MRLSTLKPTVRSTGASLRSVARPRLSPCVRSSAADTAEVAEGVSPSAAEVEGLLQAMVHETDILEMDLQIGDFHLRVKRSMLGSVVAAAPVEVAPPPSEVVPRAETPVKASAFSPMLVESVDESILSVASPKVGIFRRGRYAGNKRVGKGNCVNENDPVKKGQPIGYVEQLGTFVPVEAPVAGEMVKWEVKDGEAVEYLQTIVHMAPFFGRDLVAPA